MGQLHTHHHPLILIFLLINLLMLSFSSINVDAFAFNPKFLPPSPRHRHLHPFSRSPTYPLQAKVYSGPSNVRPSEATLRKGIEKSTPWPRADEIYRDHDKWVAEQLDLETSQRKAFNMMIGRMRASVIDRPSNSLTVNNDNNNNDQETTVDLSANPKLQASLSSAVTSNLPQLLSMRGDVGVRIMKETIANGELTFNDDLNEMLVDYTIDFLEGFVSNAAALDDGCEELLGEIVTKILECRKENDDYIDALNEIGEEEKAAAHQQFDTESLDTWFTDRRADVTSWAFTRHLEGQVSRILNAPRITPESSKLIEILRTIQARVVEEMAVGVGGEAARVISRTLQYDGGEGEGGERDAILIDELEARGLAFASEVSKLIEVAGEDFKILVNEGREDVDLEMVQRLDDIGQVTKKWMVGKK
jgi:hypothetical protein